MSSRRLSLRRPIVVGTTAGVFTIAVTVACNILFTRHYLVVSATDGAPDLGVGYWFLLAVVDVLLAGILTILIMFIVSNARQIVLMRRQESFIDGVTHELRSPLASIRLALETLDRAEVPTAVQQRLKGGMREDVERLQLFIDHILEAGRLQNRERPFMRSQTNVGEVVERCVIRLEERHSGRTGEIRIDNQTGERVTVDTDPVALEIAVLNLLDNAAKYCESDAAIRVLVSEDTGGLTVAVEDAGLGLERRDLRRVFNRFYRVRSAASLAHGTGLGLFVSRSLIRQLGGDIRAVSAGVGQGSTFTLSLPFEAK